MNSFIIPLSDPQATLETVGGKGLSLAKMINAGFPVPDGFHITTAAYRYFVDANRLQPQILAALQGVETASPASLESASARITEAFTQAPIPGDLAAAITTAYSALPAPAPQPFAPNLAGAAVAVRSSATAEDLPEASFAGQQETYLNIRGEEALLAAVVKCWASLWSARAIAYRARQGIAPETVALAVVAQAMVDANAAGILFTTNPINGRRGEMVINAAWGLGEAIVGGLVSPDIIVVEKATGNVITLEVAEKAILTVMTETGTREETLADARRKSQVLNKAQVRKLAGIARRIEDHYGCPQDIEWCLADKRFYILQSRPITTLAQAPLEWKPPDPRGIYMRTSIADLMPDPLSPLFATWGIPALKEQMKPLGARLTFAEPVLQEDYFTSINQYAYMNAAFPAKAWWWILTGMLPAYPSLLRNLAPLWRNQLHPEYQGFVAKYQDKAPEKMTAGELWQDAQEILNAAMYYACGLMFATMGASAGSEGLLTLVYNKFAKREGDPDASVLLMGWDNIPLQSEISLYELALWCQEDEALTAYLLGADSRDLAARIKAPASAPIPSFSGFAERLQTHLKRFGHLVFQLDFAEPLPLDHPELLVETIKMYLRGQGINPRERQGASQRERIQTADTMRSRLKGWKRWVFVKALNWGQTMAEVREDALAEIGLGYPILRAMLRELGKRFAAAGALEQADEIFWLEKDEIEGCVYNLEMKAGLENYTERVGQRKTFNKKAKQAIPPPMLPMKKRVMGIKSELFVARTEETQTGNTLHGIPASAGKITAPACVLRGPQDFERMRPGDALVAGTTTPAWTPLFAMASAVVTDIGGPLSHGSIVAREYGIPAVMGTGVATRRIRNGQRITVDGAKGEVTLDDEATEGGQPGSGSAWRLPNPKGVYARSSMAEQLPNPVSPLFGTLGLGSINTATLELSELMDVDLLEADYQYRVINGYVYMGFVMTPKLIWGMIKTALLDLKLMYGQVMERWLAARKTLAEARAEWDKKIPQELSPVELLAGARALMYAAGKYYTVIQASTLPTAATSELIFTRVYQMAKRQADPKASALLLGLETFALRAEKSLFDLGGWLCARPVLCAYALRMPSADLASALAGNALPEGLAREDWLTFKERFKKHLEDFGQSAYAFDFMNLTPAETPETLLDAVKGYAEGKGGDPYARQRKATELREQTLNQIHQRFKIIPNRWFDKALRWALESSRAREDSLADLGLAHTTLRRLLEELGARCMAGGALDTPADIYWLLENEIEEIAPLLAGGERLPDHTARVSQRKAEWRQQMRLTPPAMLPETSRWAKMIPWHRTGQSGNVLMGQGASAGKVTARACVLFSPEDFHKMKHGDVLVAVTTTPAWTPLFSMASAVVTDIGGALSHSSIVAREYGIPAVLATGNGTRRIRDGQTITVDGSAGAVTLL